LALQQKLLAEYEQIGQPAGFTNEEVGECLLALGREAEARPFFAKAHEALSQMDWLVAAEPERLDRLARLMFRPTNIDG
jgi:hypothetical protein